MFKYSGEIRHTLQIGFGALRYKDGTFEMAWFVQIFELRPKDQGMVLLTLCFCDFSEFIIVTLACVGTDVNGTTAGIDNRDALIALEIRCQLSPTNANLTAHDY